MSKPNKNVRGALPCGNPKRYTSSEVVQMQKYEKKHSNSTNPEVQSESDQYMKTLLKRQVDTDATIKQQFSQYRNFIESSSHAPTVTKLHGLHSVDDHVRLDEFDSTIEYLKSCGLTKEEIAFKLKQKIDDKTEASGSRGFGANPAAEELIILEIERKLREKEEALKKPDEFNGGLELSRHALLLEKAVLERQNKEGTLPEFLLKEKKVSVPSHPNDPLNHIPEILLDIDPKCSREPRRERRRKRKLNQKLLRQQKYLDVDSNPNSRQQFMESVGLLPDCESHNNDILNCDESLNECVEDKDLFESANNDESCVISSEPNSTIDNNSDDIEDRNLDGDGETKTKRKKKGVPKASGTFTVGDFSSGDVYYLTEKDAQKNRLSLQGILKIDKFQHYEQGNPNRTVFVKNLPKGVTEKDLIYLFGRFEHSDAPHILFRLLNGRMKGQAFVTFADTDTARAAITSLNGYILNGQPVILSFGKKQDDDDE